MFKILLATLSTFVATSAFAAATIRIPVFVEGNDPIPMAQFNGFFEEAGLPTFPEYFETTTGEKGGEKWQQMEAAFEKNIEALGKEFEYTTIMMELTPGANNTATLQTCYRGKAEDVVSLVFSLTDIPYSDQMNLWGWKYKNKSYIDASGDDEDGDTEKHLGSESDLWKNWKGQNEDLLILTAVGDSGDDVNESLIPLCK